jgi:hypothetical protein
VDEFFKASYLDASAAVKLVLPETGSDHVRAYFDGRGGFHMTSLCMAEALGVFKRKMLRSELSRERYFASCYLLLNYLRSQRNVFFVTAFSTFIIRRSEGSYHFFSGFCAVHRRDPRAATPNKAMRERLAASVLHCL